MGKTKKLAVLVGGTEGIGLALAKECLSEGMDVVVASRSQKKQTSAVETLKSLASDGQIVESQTIDITSFEGTRSVVEQVVEKYGAPDLLVNSAGIAHPRYIGDISESEIDQMIDLNFRGTVYLCRHFVPYMEKKKSAQILNVSSVAGYVGLFGYTTYCGSKSAVIAFTEALREELIHTGVQVSILCPPNTKTPGLDKENKKKPKEVLATEEKVKVLEPEEVARYTMKKLSSGKFMIIPTMDSQLAFYLKRYAPFILRQFVKRPQ